jgi:ketosteroid isomerase-like protein
MSDLESRLRRTEDILEIQQLFFDYGAHLDAGRFEDYASLFAEDGKVMLGPMGSATGPAEIQALMEKALGGSAGSSFHVISSPQINLDGDTATSQVMWTVLNQDDDGKPMLGMVGFHRDKLVREDGRWKFLERRGYMSLPSTYPDR